MTKPVAVSLKEAAELVGIGETLARTLVARGEFPVARLGDRLIVPVRALEEWLVQRALASVGQDDGALPTSGRFVPLEKRKGSTATGNAVEPKEVGRGTGDRPD